MRVALVHDYIKEYGGAERVLEALHEIWPKAPVYTTVYAPRYLGPHRERFKEWDIRTSWLQWVPFKERFISIFRVIAPFLFNSWDFSKYDVVIVSATGAYTPNLITKGKAIHICYCHTPPRYLYGYPTAREWSKSLVLRVLSLVANHVLRMVDYTASQRPDFFIANSQEVARRIKRFYGRDSVAIYPPVDIPATQKPNNPLSRTYFLAGGRLARPKRIDLAVAACTKLKLPLKVFGKPFAGYGDELKAIAGSTVEFLGEVSDEEKYRLMAGAKAFIFPALEEDFGITPVEAMSVSTPVIALRSGGVVESVVEGKTGIFFNEPTVDTLVNALKQFDRLKFNHVAIAKHAQKFSKERFKKEIQEFVNSRI
ncbi:glycosyltransferase [Candidatus Microgenomates bacterium]|nr:glycosyltransferase [Candidatus Microgenomates bacterium]